MQNRYKNVFVDAAMQFELLCLTIVTQDSIRSSSALKYVSVLLELPNKNSWKPIDMKLDMCDANVQKHQFLNLPAFLYCFEVITWYSSSNCAKIKLFKSKLCTFVWKWIKGVWVLLLLMLIYFGNCSDMYFLQKYTQVHKCHKTR